MNQNFETRSSSIVCDDNNEVDDQLEIHTLLSAITIHVYACVCVCVCVCACVCVSMCVSGCVCLRISRIQYDGQETTYKILIPLFFLFFFSWKQAYVSIE